MCKFFLFTCIWLVWVWAEILLFTIHSKTHASFFSGKLIDRKGRVSSKCTGRVGERRVGESR